METTKIPLSQCIGSSYQNRKGLGDVSGLARSIEVNGQITPLIVVADGEAYQLVAGHRRTAAMKSLGLEEAEHFSDHEAVVYHDDNQNGIPHAHVVVNNTNLETGRRLQDPDPKALASSLQRIAEEHGLTALRPPESREASPPAPPRTIRGRIPRPIEASTCAEQRRSSSTRASIPGRPTSALASA